MHECPSRDPQSMSNPPGGVTLFACLGGRDAVQRIIDDLYDRLERDAELRRLFRTRRAGERERQKAFFEELFGGEPLHTAGAHADSGMQRRHAHRMITVAEADRWLMHFDEAMAAAGVDAVARKDVVSLLSGPAARLANPGAPSAVFRSAFRLASRGKLAELQREVMMHPTLLNQRSGDGATLLWAAARRGHRTLVEWLVGRGADIHTPGSDVHVLSVMVSPYCAAVARGNDAIAEFLREHGARADVFTAAYLGDVEFLACLVHSEPDLLDQPSGEDDFYPVTPLHFAVDDCQVRAATYLVARGAKVRPHSRRLLTLAARHGSAEIVRLLLDSGADAREAENLGPLRAGDDTIARMLVGAGLDINARVRNRKTFLTLACRGDKGGSIDAVRILLDLGADVHATNAAGRTALEAAECGRLTDIVALLVLHGARR